VQNLCRSSMEVIREDWELRKEQNNPVFNQERIAQMMGISRSQLAKALTTDKNPTISFICSYATAVGRPMDELLYTIGRREVEEQRSFLISNQMTTRATTVYIAKMNSNKFQNGIPDYFKQEIQFISKKIPIAVQVHNV